MTEAVSEPHLERFIPFGYQREVLNLLHNYEYALNTPEILLSGSVGSAKSILLAHIAIIHCLTWPGARIAIGRRSLPDLKKTLYGEIMEHLAHINPSLYRPRRHTGEITFPNGSEIISATWGDGLYAKFRSLKLSGLIIEELTENDDQFMPGFKILKARVRRIPSVKQNFVIAATNPGEPDSLWYQYFIEGAREYPSRYVFYSNTRENPYLEAVYYDQLLQDYSVLEAERYLRGKWISLEGKGIYHAYSEERNYRDKPYEPDLSKPFHICFDFNTAEGKPQSACIFQYVKGEWHFFAESIIDRANWCLDNLTDFEAQGILKGVQMIYVHGDASGKAKSSNSLRSNYELIEDWLAQKRIPFRMQVPKSNPPLVERWTTVNALCQNAKLEVRIFVYKTCPVLNQGMKLARKKPGTALEDDSQRYQHVTTAAGYGICYTKVDETRKSSSERY